MTTKEMLVTVLQGIQNNASNENNDYNRDEMLFILNRAQEEFIELNLKPNDVSGLMAFLSFQAKANLHPLTVKNKISMAFSINEQSRYGMYSVLEFAYDANALESHTLINDFVLTEMIDDNGGIKVYNCVIMQKPLSNHVHNVYSLSDVSVMGRFEEGKVSVLYPDAIPTVEDMANYHLQFLSIRKPKIISDTQDCELPSITHPQICKLAINQILKNNSTLNLQ